MNLVLLLGCAEPAVHRDEQVTFFPTVGYPVSGGADWVLPIHGWVYEQSFWGRNLGEFIDAMGDGETAVSPEQRIRLEQRLAPFVADNKDGSRVPVVLGNRTVLLGPAGDMGQIREEIRVSASNIEVSGGAAILTGGINEHKGKPLNIEYRAVCGPRDSRELIGRVYLVPSTGLSVVSDIDDTIRIADVNNTKKLLKGTFAEPLQPVEGMADVYTAWQRSQGAAFHYLSAEPIQMYATLAEFLSSKGFPQGSMSLRTVKWSGNMLQAALSMFDAPPEFKTLELAWLMQILPDRRYVLVGDSGQNDPEVYGAIAQRFPQQVSMIFIRAMDCCTERGSPRYAAAFAGVPESKWMLFRNASELKRWTPPSRDSDVQQLFRRPWPRRLLAWSLDAVPADRYEATVAWPPT